MWKEFREFIMRGNVVDLAVGVIIGGAFGAIVTSLVNDILSPLLGLLTGGVDFSNVVIPLTDEAALGIGNFINAIILFLLTALALFFVIRAVNRLMESRKQEEEAAEEAPAEPTTEEKLLDAINELTAAIQSQNS